MPEEITAYNRYKQQWNSMLCNQYWLEKKTLCRIWNDISPQIVRRYLLQIRIYLNNCWHVV